MTHRKIVAGLFISADGVVGAPPDWANSEVLDGDLVRRLTELKQMPGRNINTSGSIRVVRTLLEAGLIDDLHLMVFPVALGDGMRLFPSRASGST